MVQEPHGKCLFLPLYIFESKNVSMENAQTWQECVDPEH